MSLVDDLKHIERVGPWYDEGGGVYACRYCGNLRNSPRHSPRCCWLSMPKIVAALEAAETVAITPSMTFSDHDPEDERPDTHPLICRGCGEEITCDCTEEECDTVATWVIAMERNYRRIVHDDDCAAQAFIAALEGES